MGHAGEALLFLLPSESGYLQVRRSNLSKTVSRGAVDVPCAIRIHGQDSRPAAAEAAAAVAPCASLHRIRGSRT